MGELKTEQNQDQSGVQSKFFFSPFKTKFNDKIYAILWCPYCNILSGFEFNEVEKSHCKCTCGAIFNMDGRAYKFIVAK
jgi:hypothetical protein